MPDGLITSGIDIAELVLIAFVIFFFGLVFYLRREDRREGYPLEADTTGKLEPAGAVWMPGPKEFRMPDGSVKTAPHDQRDGPGHGLRRLAVWPGAPSEPTGDGMRDGVGPAAYARREDKPDRTHEGDAKIAPMRAMSQFSVAKEDADPRGMDVVGADGKSAGKISDLWIDRSEALIRYLEVELAADGRKVLLPMPFANVKGRARKVEVKAILAEQFAGVPSLKSPDQVTRLEEDQISAYYAGGLLYATPDRAEPWI